MEHPINNNPFQKTYKSTLYDNWNLTMVSQYTENYSNQIDYNYKNDKDVEDNDEYFVLTHCHKKYDSSIENLNFKNIQINPEIQIFKYEYKKAKWYNKIMNKFNLCNKFKHQFKGQF